MSPHILMLTYNRQYHGTYWRALGFAREAVQNGYTVTLISSSSKAHKLEVSQFEQINLLVFPERWPGHGYDIIQTLLRHRWIKKERFDLVHIFETRPTNLFPSVWLKRRGIPMVVDWADWFGEGGAVEERKNGIQKNILKKTETYFENNFRQIGDKTTVINTVLEKRAVSLGVATNDILVLPNGSNVAEFKIQDKPAVQEQLNLPINVPIIAYTGAIFQRDAELMAECLNLLFSRVPNAYILLIGYFNVNLEDHIAQSNRIIRTGFVTYELLTKYLSAASIGWLPLSDSGANQGRFPMKASDFIAAGLPIVATDVGDIGDFIRENDLGLVSKSNVPDMVDTLARALCNPDCLPSPEHIRSVAQNKFSWANISAPLMEMYASLLAERQRDSC